MLWAECSLPLLACVELLFWIHEKALNDILGSNMHCTREVIELTGRAIFSTLLGVSSIPGALFDAALFLALTISCDCIESHFNEGEYKYPSRSVRSASGGAGKKVSLKIFALLFDAVIRPSGP